MVLASETGVLDVASEDIRAKGRLRPGKLFLVDLENDRVVADTAVKRELSERQPYGEWLADRVVRIEDLPEKTPRVPRVEPLRAKQLAFGWTEEDLRVLLAADGARRRRAHRLDGQRRRAGRPLGQAAAALLLLQAAVRAGHEPGRGPDPRVGGDEPEATIGPEVNLLDETPEHCHQLVMPQPILWNSELEKLRQVDHDVFEARTIDMTWPVEEGAAGMERRVQEICAQASELVDDGVNIIVLSDRNLGAERVPMPALLATSAVHHHLVREGTRLRIGLVAETGQAREIHHVACLIGYGASAVNPYLMFESLHALHRDGRLPEGMTADEAQQRVIKAVGKGLLKVLSKMGISTIRSYTGAQIFEAVGLEKELVDRHFTGTPSRIGGVGLERARPRGARPPRARLSRRRLGAAALGRHLRLAPRRRVPRLEPGDGGHAPARRARRRTAPTPTSASPAT